MKHASSLSTDHACIELYIIDNKVPFVLFIFSSYTSNIYDISILLNIYIMFSQTLVEIQYITLLSFIYLEIM